jgi:hypothetical protein
VTDQQLSDGLRPDAADEQLLADLRRVAARADPVPEALIMAARAAFGLREIDASVAELVRDSAIGASATAVRGPGARMLSFEAADTVIECEVTARGSRRRDVTGQLVGAVAALVQVQVAGARVVDVPVDDFGRFSVGDLPAGPFRLRCSLADGSTALTSWTAV